MARRPRPPRLPHRQQCRGRGRYSRRPAGLAADPAVEVGETFTDNVNLAPRGSRLWDFITTVCPA